MQISAMCNSANVQHQDEEPNSKYVSPDFDQIHTAQTSCQSCKISVLLFIGLLEYCTQKNSSIQVMCLPHCCKPSVCKEIQP